MPTRDPILKRFGQDVREKREARRLSQEALAEQADLDRTYLGGIERGEGNPTILSALHASVVEIPLVASKPTQPRVSR